MIHIQQGASLPITADAARDYIQQHTDNFGVFIDLDRVNEYIFIFYVKGQKVLKAISHLTGMPITGKQSMLDFLASAQVPYGLYNGSLSEEARTAIKRADLPQEVKACIVLWEQYTSLSYLVSILQKYAEQPALDFPGKRGERIACVHPNWKVLNTGRIQTNTPNVQGIPRECKDIIVEPPGYSLQRCDSSQIEPRLNFSWFIHDELVCNLIMAYGDAYYGILAYALMSAEEDRKFRQDFSTYTVKEENETIKSSRQAIKRLTNAGSYGGGIAKLYEVVADIPGGFKIADAYEARILNHPRRAQKVQEVKEQVRMGNTIFHGAFGTPVIPDVTSKYQPGTAGWAGHVERCGINNPIQTTAAELMLFSVAHARECLTGTTSHIAFYKHDEACFYISDRDMANGLGEQLSGITAYQVDGWLPIPADDEYGIITTDTPTMLYDYGKDLH